MGFLVIQGDARPAKNDGRFKKGQHWRSRKPFWDAEWCRREYLEKGRSSGDIAEEFGVTPNAIMFWLKKHGIVCRSMSEVRSRKKWGACGPENPMWGKKGDLNPNWKGGISAERQAYYASEEWRLACSFVWSRDEATCQRCGLRRGDSPGTEFHVHHIVSFAVVELRAEPTNLILLCEPCHSWVHSLDNTAGDFVKKGG